MPIKICPNCNQRYTVGFDCTDVIHNCGEQVGAAEVVKQEDVLVIGNWEDDLGQGTISSQEVMRQGMTNELWGTRAGIEGEKKQLVTGRGARKSTHRQRNKLTYIDLKNEKKD